MSTSRFQPLIFVHLKETSTSDKTTITTFKINL